MDKISSFPRSVGPIFPALFCRLFTQKLLQLAFFFDFWLATISPSSGRKNEEGQKYKKKMVPCGILVHGQGLPSKQHMRTA